MVYTKEEVRQCVSLPQHAAHRLDLKSVDCGICQVIDEQPCTALDLDHLSAEPKLVCMNISGEGADNMRWSLAISILLWGSM